MLPAQLAYPVTASQDGSAIDRLLVQVHLLMGGVFIVWLIIFVFALWRSRHNRGTGKPLSPVFVYGTAFVVMCVELLLELGVSNPIMAARSAAAQSSEGALELRVVAQRYAWNVHYPGPDGVFGSARPELVNDAGNPLGLDLNDPHAKDDIVKLNEIHVPVNRKVIVWLSSRDVVHSFNSPEMRVKQDAIPGMRIAVPFTPMMSTAEFRKVKGDPERNFEIACAQLCGQGHASMRALLIVDTAEEFAAWLSAQTGAGEDDWDAP